MPPEINLDDVYRTFKETVQYQIRSMHEIDLDIVVDIDRATWGDISWRPKDFVRALRNPLWNCWILESGTNDHRLLGYGLQRIADDVSHITNLCIHPNQRGRGLGGILLRFMIDHSREMNASIVNLEVETLNTRAYKLYRNHGFRISRFLFKYYSDDSHAYQMTLFLT
jgi:ribosomal-protein-alanine N-acetyltransferase